MIITNKFGLPEPIVVAIQNDNYDFRSDSHSISVTTLIDSAYIRYLTRLHWDEITCDVVDFIHPARGQGMHAILERAGSRYIHELRLDKVFTVDIDPDANGNYIETEVLVSGKLDLFDPRSRILTDYKDTKAWEWIYNAKGKESWVIQLNILAYLLEEHDLTVAKLQLCLFFKDWSRVEYAKNKHKGYPEHEVGLIEPSRMPKLIVENYIKRRINAHMLNNPEPCSPQERWRSRSDWAIIPKGKDPVTTRATKRFSNPEDATDGLYSLKNPTNYTVVERVGEDVRCLRFCLVKQWCTYYQEKYTNPITIEEEGYNEE